MGERNVLGFTFQFLAAIDSVRVRSLEEGRAVVKRKSPIQLADLVLNQNYSPPEIKKLGR